MSKFHSTHDDNLIGTPQGAGFVGLLAVTPPTPPSSKANQILRMPEVVARVGLCRASIYLLMDKGLFPKSIAIGRRAVGWLESEIEAWIVERMKRRT